MSTFDRRIVSLTWRQFFGWIVSSDEHVTRVSIAPVEDLLNLSLVSFSSLDQLGVDPAARDFTQLAGQARLANGQMIAKPEPVFPRFVDEADTNAG